MNTTADMLPLDVMPEELASEAPPKQSSPFVWWLLVLGAGLAFIPLFMTNTIIQSTNDSLQAEYEGYAATLTAVPATDPEVAAAMSALSDIRLQITQLDSIRLSNQPINWPLIAAIIGNYDSTQVAVLGVRQEGNHVVVSGQATSEMAAMTYVQALSDSKQFSRVVLQSIKLTAAPVPAPENQPLGDNLARVAEFAILLEIEAVQS